MLSYIQVFKLRDNIYEVHADNDSYFVFENLPTVMKQIDAQYKAVVFYENDNSDITDEILHDMLNKLNDFADDDDDD